MIYVKKEISRIAALLLFDQNVQTTWDRFTGQAVPFLDSIKTRLGLSDFKVLLDESTTTPDLIDRNILYAKIFLLPKYVGWKENRRCIYAWSNLMKSASTFSCPMICSKPSVHACNPQFWQRLPSLRIRIFVDISILS